MKKLLLFFFIITLASCSDDDNSFSPKIPGENIEEGTIQFVFEANGNQTIEFTITSSNTDQIRVDWGDANSPTSRNYSPTSPITYTYNKATNGEKYVITIYAPKLQTITVSEETTPNIKEAYFGDLKEILGFSFDGGQNNTLEILDLTKCVRFDDGDFTLPINSSKFNMQGLKNAGSISAIVLTSMDELNSSNLAVQSFSLLISGNNYISNLSLDNNINLKSLFLSKYNGFFKYTNTISDISFENSPLTDITIQGISTNKFDVSKSTTLEKLRIVSFDSPDTIMILPESLTKFYLASGDLTEPAPPYNLKTVDFSKSKNIEQVNIEFCSLLKNVFFKDNENIEYISITNNNIEKIRIENSNIDRFSFWGLDKLNELYLRNLAQLTSLEITNSRFLQSIDTDNLPSLDNIDISNNNFSSQAIEDLFQKVPDTPLVSEDNTQRKMLIQGNPGDNAEVRSLIEKNGNWKIVDYAIEEASSSANIKSVSNTDKLAISGTIAKK